MCIPGCDASEIFDGGTLLLNWRDYSSQIAFMGYESISGFQVYLSIMYVLDLSKWRAWCSYLKAVDATVSQILELVIYINFICMIVYDSIRYFTPFRLRIWWTNKEEFFHGV